MILDAPDKIRNLKPQTGKEQILYVEDDRYSQVLVEQILRNEYDVDVAPHARDVMTWVKLKDYDLILMDIKLDDGFSGIELARRIKEMPRYAEVPILAVTAIAFPGDLEDMVRQGCSDTITKPIDLRVFKAKIARLFMQKKPVPDSKDESSFRAG